MVAMSTLLYLVLVVQQVPSGVWSGWGCGPVGGGVTSKDLLQDVGFEVIFIPLLVFFSQYIGRGQANLCFMRCGNM